MFEYWEIYFSSTVFILPYIVYIKEYINWNTLHISDDLMAWNEWEIHPSIIRIILIWIERVEKNQIVVNIKWWAQPFYSFYLTGSKTRIYGDIYGSRNKNDFASNLTYCTLKVKRKKSNINFYNSEVRAENIRFSYYECCTTFFKFWMACVFCCQA